MYLSRTYALIDEFPSSLSLNARAKLYAREARSTASTLDSDDPAENAEAPDFAGELLPLTPAAFVALDVHLATDYDRFTKCWGEATGGRVDRDPENLSLAELNLDGSRGTKAAAKKQPFYDVAFSYVVAFDMEAIARKAGLRGEVKPDVVEQVVPKMEVDDEEESGEEDEDAKPAEKKGWGFGLFGRK